MAQDVEHLRSRSEYISDIMHITQYLKYAPHEIGPYTVGLGSIKLEYKPLCCTYLQIFPVFCIGERPVTGPCAHDGPVARHRYIENNITDCTVRSWYIPHYEQGYSVIDLKHNSTRNTHNCSCVLPKHIANSTMICLPQITNADYEKEVSNKHVDAQYYVIML